MQQQQDVQCRAEVPAQIPPKSSRPWCSEEALRWGLDEVVSRVPLDPEYWAWGQPHTELLWGQGFFIWKMRVIISIISVCYTYVKCYYQHYVIYITCCFYDILCITVVISNTVSNEYYYCSFPHEVVMNIEWGNSYKTVGTYECHANVCHCHPHDFCLSCGSATQISLRFYGWYHLRLNKTKRHNLLSKLPKCRNWLMSCLINF